MERLIRAIESLMENISSREIKKNPKVREKTKRVKEILKTPKGQESNKGVLKYINAKALIEN